MEPKLKIGKRMCQCCACKEYFNSVSPFEEHRRFGSCRKPQELGMVKNKGGFWIMYKMKDECKQRMSSGNIKSGYNRY